MRDSQQGRVQQEAVVGPEEPFTEPAEDRVTDQRRQVTDPVPTMGVRAPPGNARLPPQFEHDGDHRGGVRCPFEGEVRPETIERILRGCIDAGPDEIALADTIGVGVPPQVDVLADVAAAVAPGVPLRWHFHNTRNTGYANAFAALQRGAVALDASIGGIGGCPFAPAATGNLATEDLLYLLHRSGVRTGMDPAVLIDAAPALTADVGHEVAGQLSRAGWFPRID